jgi:hypothetical protein
MSKNSIDKLHDEPQTGDRVVFDSETESYEIIIRRDGDTIYCTENNTDSEAKSFARDIEWALTADDDAEYKDKPKNPTETIETIAKFRERILKNLGSIRLVILEPRKGERYEVDSAIIDELHDNPQTGDQIVFNAGASMQYRRTIIRKGDTIEYQETDMRQTIEEFGNRIIENLNSILVVLLAPRGNSRKKR